MSVNPSTKWPTRTTAVSGAYPYGSSKDETTPGANDGTPYEKARADDIFGLQQALLKFAGIVPSGNADTATASQYLEALLDVALAGGFFEDNGAADAYEFDIVSGTDRQGPVGYTDGLEVSAVIANTNTGASTVDVNSIGAKNIFYNGGALTAGLLTAGDSILLKYDAGNDRFNLLRGESVLMDLVRAQTAAGVKTFTAGIVASGGVQTDGSNTLKTKIIDIGDWDMDGSINTTVLHGLTLANIRSVTALIRNDADDQYFDINSKNLSEATTIAGIDVAAASVALRRSDSGVFDTTDFNSTSYNRGWIMITYIA